MSTKVYINPRYPDSFKKKTTEQLLLAIALDDHMWFSTSGTTGAKEGAMKWAALSKKALLASAKSVNTHLEACREDIWLNPLPAFHVGGYSISVRSELSGAKEETLPKWDPEAFCKLAESTRATLSALVPTQVYDLLAQKRRSPKSLRAIVVGGGALPEEAYTLGKELGWPLLPSYGLTECASQVATAKWGSPALQLLAHMEVRTEPDGRLALKSEALLTTYAFIKGEEVRLFDPKVKGWLVTEDLGTVEGSTITINGRVGRVVKIGGESVDLARLDFILQEVKEGIRFAGDAALILVENQRLGHEIHLAVEKAGLDVETLVQKFQNQVLPFEAIRHVHVVKKIERTPLGKLRTL